MDKRLFGLFSGAQVASMVCVAVLAPSVLLAAVTFSNVALVNPTTGTPAAVDAAGRVSVLDAVANYRNFPANYVDIYINNTPNDCLTGSAYVVPAGKAFIITGVSGYVYQFGSGTPYTGFQLYDGVSCTGHYLTNYFTSPPAGQPYVPLNVNYEAGIPVPAGSTVTLQTYNNNGVTFIHGYLVPASTVVASAFATVRPANASSEPGKPSR